ncbi:MAG TPA: SH3 domain-containing protein [Candidatus Paceibacterota bacterium]|nr:SH3 domain-containing protein [Candidatus Paceibacterota bacterium]
MNTNCWIILTVMLAAGAVAQDTNGLPEMPAPVTSPAAEVTPAPAPADTGVPEGRHARRVRTVTPKKLVEPTVTLVPGPAEVAVTNLNVRGQAGLKGEFLTHLNAGDSVTVLGEITLGQHKPYEPAQWAKIALPAGVKVWVSAQFIDATNDTVLPKKLNLRAGPGENYSVLGDIERGASVSAITTKDGWMQIEAPTNAYAFVAAMYLKQEVSGTMPTNVAPSEETEPPLTTNSVAEPEPIVTEPPTNAAPATDTNVAPAAVETNAAPSIDTNAIPAVVPAVDNTTTSSAPRIVSHEGVVVYTISPNAPTNFKLYDPSTYETVDYLYTTATNLDLNRYVNMRIIVTGAEGLDERWPNTPVITIQRIEVLDTNAVPTTPIKHKH